MQKKGRELVKYYVVDAFTDELFKGNQAGVCLPDKWPDEELMQKIAFENNLDFPSRKPSPVALTAEMCKAIGATALEAHLSRDLVLLLKDEQQVHDLTPDFELIKQLDFFAVVVTAKGNHADFVSRFFTPGAGVPEDPVTGSAHSTLIPFWAERLGKDKMTAKQLSARGGTLFCENIGERVKIAGKAVLYLQGELRM